MQIISAELQSVSHRTYQKLFPFLVPGNFYRTIPYFFKGNLMNRNPNVGRMKLSRIGSVRVLEREEIVVTVDHYSCVGDVGLGFNALGIQNRQAYFILANRILLKK